MDDLCDMDLSLKIEKTINFYDSFIYNGKKEVKMSKSEKKIEKDPKKSGIKHRKLRKEFLLSS